MKQLTNYILPKNQVFVCINPDGYINRLRLKSRAEKQQMYNYYPFVIQTGLYCKDMVKIRFNDGSEREINPNKLRFGKHEFFSRKPVDTIWLEPNTKVLTA